MYANSSATPSTTLAKRGDFKTFRNRKEEDMEDLLILLLYEGYFIQMISKKFK
jgi:hypothetical protein